MLILLFSSLNVFAQTESTPCDWITGNWVCLEESTKKERSLAILSEDIGAWKVAMYDDEIPDRASDEWVLHKIGKKQDMGAGIKETTSCSEEGALSVKRVMMLFGTVYMNIEKVSDAEMRLSNMVEQVGTEYSSEKFQCRRL